MIVAIADDFSGAAEIGGIALNLGLDVEVQINPDLDVHRDIVIIDTNTRSKSVSFAKKFLDEITGLLKTAKVEWIYKKTDSVLRGHVVSELESLLTGLKMESALVIPANPSQGRTIKKGQYFIDGVHLHRTKFMEDPEYPAKSSEVTKILGNSDLFEVKIQERPERIAPRAIVVGESNSDEDMKRWIRYMDDDILPAGGADFFSSLLTLKYGKYKNIINEDVYTPGKRRLIVMGSTSGLIKEGWPEVNKRSTPVCQIPCNIAREGDSLDICLDKWIRNICIALKGHNQVLAVVNQSINQTTGTAVDVPALISRMVSAVFEKNDIDELIIEGGSTASQILRGKGWKRLVPVKELSRGVVVLDIIDNPGCRLIVKPGSYPWPNQLWKYN